MKKTHLLLEKKTGSLQSQKHFLEKIHDLTVMSVRTRHSLIEWLSCNGTKASYFSIHFRDFFFFLSRLAAACLVIMCMQ